MTINMPQPRKHLIWSYVSTTGANAIRVGLGVVSGLIVARLFLPQERGRAAILLYFPTLMGALFSLGTPQAITALISKSDFERDKVLTAGFRLAILQSFLAVPLFMGIAPLTLTGDNRNLGRSGNYFLCLRRLHDSRALLQCDGIWVGSALPG